uniref:DUF1572 domain-containing protein n=1 Tax=Gelidibacter sp. TaxID=2018083 RepID=UPI004048F501
MQSSKQLAERFREVIFDGLWIANTNYKDQLSNVTMAEATKKVDTFNTIAALTYHINYYIEGVSIFFETGELTIKDQFSFDLPEMTSENDWELLKSRFWHNAETFATQIEQMSNEQLDDIFVLEKYGTYQRNIDAIIEHSYYHLGQIVLIKKMMKTSSNY